MSRRIAFGALAALAVGLPLHNLAMAELWDAGLRGNALDAVSAWKELVLAAGLVALTFGLPARIRLARIDLLALAYAAVVLVWAVLPQDWLGGEAHAKGILYAVRHDLTPVAAYFLGRGLALSGREVKRVALLVGISAAAVAAWGLVDVYAVSLEWWRGSGAPGWFGEQLGLDYKTSLSGLPENFVYNPGNEEPVRRLVSTFLSPLATAYMLVVALLAAAAWPSARRLALLAPLLAAGLLFTDSRSAIAALAVGLVALAWAQRRWWPVVAAAAVLAGGAAFVKAYEHIGPQTSFTPAELVYLRENAARHPGASHDPLSASESSASSHLRNLRDGIETVLRHPQGYGPGNAGVTALRTGVELKAGESTYTELGVEAGLLGALLFVAWSLALLRVALAREPWVGASLAAVLALGLQTDVIGVHWLAFVLWALAGSTLPGWRSIPASTSATST